MSEYIKGIRTQSGVAKIDYNSLANLPTLTPEGINAAPAEHVHTSNDISDVLPPEKGGTGGTTPAEARESLEITPANIGAAPSDHSHELSDLVSDALPINKGGTEATTAVDALKNLGALSAVSHNGVIAANDNLNNYTSVGVYLCENSSVAASVTNSPIITAGYKIAVFVGYVPNSRYQIALLIDNQICIRYTHDMSTWSEWVSIINAVFPISRGGTGATKAVDALANLGALSADSYNGVIKSGENLNNYTTVGVYVSPTSTTSKAAENSPTTSSGYKLFVLNGYGTTSILQMAFGNSAQIYARYSHDKTTWGEWSELTNPAVMPIEKGGTNATDGATGLKNLFAAGPTVLSPHQYGSESQLPLSGVAGQLFIVVE